MSTTTQQVIHSRSELFENLSHAISSESARSVLVLFGFQGLNEYLETTGPEESDALIERIGQGLATALAGHNELYQPRRGEFCGLFEGGLRVIRSYLVTVPAELDAELRPLPIRTALGIAILPDEATEPTYALSLADHRLQALSGKLRLK